MENVVYSGMIGTPQAILIIFFIAVIVLWIKTIIEIASATFIDDSKIVWLLIVILLGILGMIIYYIAGRSKRDLNNRKNESEFDILEH